MGRENFKKLIFLVIGYWYFVIGIWLLVIGIWLLVIGIWLLVFGYWYWLLVLVIGFGPNFKQKKSKKLEFRRNYYLLNSNNKYQ